MRKRRSPTPKPARNDVDEALAAMGADELGTANDKAAIRKRAAEALQDCPQHTHRQRAFLHGLLGDFESAAKLLGAAPGLGWSEGEHPGHLLFPLFQAATQSLSSRLLIELYSAMIASPCSSNQRLTSTLPTRMFPTKRP